MSSYGFLSGIPIGSTNYVKFYLPTEQMQSKAWNEKLAKDKAKPRLSTSLAVMNLDID